VIQTNAKKRTFLTVLSGLGLCGFALMMWLYPSLFPLGSVTFSQSELSLKGIAANEAKASGFILSDDEEWRADIVSDETLMQYTETNLSIKRQREVLQDSLPVFQWTVTGPRGSWADPSSSAKAYDSLSVEWVVTLDLQGSLSGWTVTLLDEDPDLSSLSEAEARSMADSVARTVLGQNVHGFDLTQPVIRFKQTTSRGTSDYEFDYSKIEPVAGIPVTLTVGLTGPLVTTVEHTYTAPEQKVGQLQQILEYLPRILFVLAMMFAYVIMIVGKLRADGLSFRYSTPYAIVAGLITAASVFLDQVDGSVNWMEVILGSVFASVFAAITILFALACVDAMTREIWDDKLITLDTLRKGRLLYKRFGHVILRGLATGGILLGVYAVVIFALDRSTGVDLTAISSEMDVFNSASPFLHSLLNGLMTTIWHQWVVALFLVTLLAKILGQRFWIIAIIAVLWGVGLSVLSDPSPYILKVSLGLILGSVSAYLILQYDFMTALITQFTTMIGFDAIRFYHTGYPSLTWAAGGLLGVLVVLAVIALVARRRDIHDIEPQHYVPSYVNKIVERERLRRELDIARRVQLSFLPRSQPQVSGLDVASVCLPAFEVGGDYYDYIVLNDHQLGVAIGDVSGKGISAAFYMTLTKGFLRSLIRSLQTPSNVLSQINRLFYENVERGHFISLIYGIFDTREKTFTFARAGHNPVITIRSKEGHTSRLCPSGIALGLEKGDLFDAVIEEQTITIESGDVFVFYTDGFNEAMNATLEEFGEDRLEAIIQQSGHQNAQGVVNQVVETVEVFVGKANRHDDMTLVVVRAV
jgi:sigma-B regulation protein RsbU (phosphoserine phosphatase)